MEAVADNAASRPLGQILAAERERQGLSRADVAQRLHMSAYQVEALEAGDYARLPRGTFLRGFVRNYAKVLGIAPDTVLSQLAETTPRENAPGIVVPSQNIRFEPLGQRLSNPYVKAAALTFVALALGFAAMYWWLFIRPAPLNPPTHKTPVPEIAPDNSPPPVAPSLEVPPDRTLAPPELPAAEPATKSAPSDKPAEPTAPAAAPVSDGGRVLKFHFKGSSWVEVRDRAGKVLFSKLNPSDSDAEVSGKPPFKVVVGNAPQVQVYYNDREFDLEPHTNVAVARFTLE